MDATEIPQKTFETITDALPVKCRFCRHLIFTRPDREPPREQWTADHTLCLNHMVVPDLDAVRYCLYYRLVGGPGQ